MTARRRLRSAAAAAATRDPGFALLVTLWVLVLVSLLVLQLTEAGGAQARLGGNLRRAAIAEAGADGAVAEAGFRLLAGGSDWHLSGGVYALPIPGGRAEIEVRNEAGRIDLNNASPTVLQALLSDQGLNPREAATLVEQIVAWRTTATDEQRREVDAPYLAAHRTELPPLAPFESVSELGLVLGMTPALLARLAPHLTVYQVGDPVASVADPVVRRVLEAAGGGGGTQAAFDPTRDDVVRLTVTATVGGGRYVRRAVLQLEPGDNQAPFRVLAWD